jgi:hypothetical protein
LQNNSIYNWEIDHGDPSDKDSEIIISIKPKLGLLSKWRLILPANYNGLIKWGIISDEDQELKVPRGIFETGNIKLNDGQVVVVFGGVEPVTKNKSARIIVKSPPPHFIGFGFSEDDASPPMSIEGITFEDHPH